MHLAIIRREGRIRIPFYDFSIAGGALYSLPVFINAQITRSILFAIAVATTLNGRRCRRELTHGGMAAPFRDSFRIAIAPTTRSERSRGFPRFEIEPSFSLPPLERDLGVKPIQAAKSLPDRKPPGSGTAALTVAAVICGAAIKVRARIASFGFVPELGGVCLT